MTLEQWMKRFCIAAAVGIDEAVVSQRYTNNYGFPLIDYLGQDWETERRETMVNLIRKAMNDMLMLQPSFESALLAEDPENMAITLAPSIASQLMKGEP